MANDLDPTYSPTAFAPSRRVSTASASSPTPGDDGLARLKSSSQLGAKAATNGYDTRRTQSATELSRQRAASSSAASPVTSTASSPRSSFAESFSRSGSFLSNLTQIASGISNAIAAPPSPTAHRSDAPVRVVTVVYEEPGPLYVDLYSRADGRGAFVKSFRRRTDGAMGNAEASGEVRVNDMLYSINDLVVTDLVFASIIQAAKTASFPCTLVFHSRLPPLVSSPSSTAVPSPAKVAATGSTWSSKFGQVVGESSVKRSASFDRKSFGESVSSPASVPRRPSSGASTPSTPPMNGSSGGETPGKQKNWGESIEKVKNSDGMKNLLRMMGGNRGRPEEDRDTVETWMDHLLLRLENGQHQDTGAGHLISPLVVMTTANGGRTLGTKEEDLDEFAFTWYRKTQAQDLIQIRGVRGGRYYPSIDDVDTRISVRCQSYRFPQLVRVVEFQHPLVIDPAVKEMVDVLLEAGAGSFSATLASNEFDSFQIKISETRVTLVKISEAEDEGGVVADAEYHTHLQVLVDPSDQLRFTLKVHELGSMLGCREGDVCDIKRKQQLSSVSCFFLVAQNPQHRDILTLLIRRFRARAVIKEEEDIAHRDELNLFVDPASSVNGSGPLIGPFAGVSDDGSPSVTAESASSSVRRSFMSAMAQADLRRSNQPKTSPVESPGTGPQKFTDFFELEDRDGTTPRVGSESQAPSSRTGSFTHASPARSSLGSTSDSIQTSDQNGFAQDRLLAQGKEIMMLQEKLASMSVLVKATEHEKSELVASLEVKDKRIEAQQMRLQQLERTNVQLATSCREIHTLKTRLDDETRLHQACQQQLAKALVEREELDLAERSSQTDNQVEMCDAHRVALEDANQQVTRLSDEVQQLTETLSKMKSQALQLQRENNKLIGERNALRTRSAELAKELKIIIGPYGSAEEIKSMLAERTHLTTQLAIARAEAKRVNDEMQEYKDALDTMVKQQQTHGDTSGSQRLASQNVELQRLVHQLTDSLNETREQMNAMKKINSALVAKMQEENPHLRGSILESPPMSPFSATSSVHDPRFSDDEDEDDEEDDEDEGFGRSTPASIKKSSEHEEEEEEFGDALEAQ